MSQSTDAILVFGIDYGGEPNFPWRDEDNEDLDLETWWAKLNGLSEPEVEFSEKTKPLFHEYWEKKTELFKACPIEELTHCSGEYPMYILAVKGTEKKASRGYPEYNVSLEPVDSFTLIKFCQDHNISMPSKPSWILCSDWN